MQKLSSSSTYHTLRTPLSVATDESFRSGDLGNLLTLFAADATDHDLGLWVQLRAVIKNPLDQLNARVDVTRVATVLPGALHVRCSKAIRADKKLENKLD